MMETAIIIPCYNEEMRLQTDEIISFLKAHRHLHFYLVNDGSTDKTLNILKTISEESERCYVLDVQPNQGKAHAVFAGFNEAFKQNHDYIGFWDADLATPLDIIDRFTELLDSGKYDCIFGCRIQRLGSNIKRKATRHYLGRFFATLISHILKLPVYDTQCGAKIFRNSKMLRDAFAVPFTTKWVFDVELIAKLQQLYKANGIDFEENVFEYPLTEWNDISGSKVKFIDGIAALLDLLKIKRKY